jgi:Na+/H+ antiporter NhaD/arsenite permease-like protein
VLFRKVFQHNPEQVDAVMALKERRAITDPAMLRRCLVVLAAVITGFALHSVLHLDPSIVVPAWTR